ncbi:hypothetical protein N2152v2_009202 [Parachlorella kessleri]
MGVRNCAGSKLQDLLRVALPVEDSWADVLAIQRAVSQEWLPDDLGLRVVGRKRTADTGSAGSRHGKRAKLHGMPGALKTLLGRQGRGQGRDPCTATLTEPASVAGGDPLPPPPPNQLPSLALQPQHLEQEQQQRADLSREWGQAIVHFPQEVPSAGSIDEPGPLAGPTQGVCWPPSSQGDGSSGVGSSPLMGVAAGSLMSLVQRFGVENVVGAMAKAAREGAQVPPALAELLHGLIAALEVPAPHLLGPACWGPLYASCLAPHPPPVAPRIGQLGW